MSQETITTQNNFFNYLKYNKELLLQNIQTLISDISDFKEVITFNVDIDEKDKLYNITIDSEDFSDLFPSSNFSSAFIKNHGCNYDSNTDTIILPMYCCFTNRSGENIYSKFIDLQISRAGHVKFRSSY